MAPIILYIYRYFLNLYLLDVVAKKKGGIHSPQRKERGECVYAVFAFFGNDRHHDD